MTLAEAIRPLRVGLNLLFLGERAGGIGRYARELPGALLDAEAETEIHVFVSRDAPADLLDQQWAARVRFVRLPVCHRPPPPYLVAQYVGIPAVAAARRLDVVHSPANVGPVITPGVASVVSLMDVIWMRHTQEWESDPRAERALRRQVGHAVRHADRILTISETAAGEIAETLGVERTRLGVTPLGVRPAKPLPLDGETIRERLSLGRGRVILCVAQKRPYKNLHSLVAAMPRLPDDTTLVLPGAPTVYEAELRARAEAIRVAERVRLPGWLDEDDLESLYGVASLFVLPSLSEGFGLPVLEAMAHGVPVACSNIPTLVEVAGDAATLFDPHDQDEVTFAIRRVLDDPGVAASLVERGYRRAALFTWRRTGQLTLAGYRAALAARGADRGSGTSLRR